MICMTNFMATGIVDLGQSVGKTPEEIGEWLGEYSARSWGGPGSITLTRFVRQTFLNHNLWRELEFEILSETEDEIRFRTNMPWTGPPHLAAVFPFQASSLRSPNHRSQ